jgi:hypothetical protein
VVRGGALAIGFAGTLFLIATAQSCSLASDLALPGCVPKTLPAKKAASDGPSIPASTFAVRRIRFGGDPKPGFALDGSCACALKCVPRNNDRDAACPLGPSPVDNATLALFGDLKARVGAFGATIPDADQSANDTSLTPGLAAVLVTLREYSGKSEDPFVRVRIASSAGTNGVKPKFDGTDSFADSDVAKEVDGYVSNGTVFASFGDLRVRVQVDQDYHLANALFAGKLRSDGSGELIEGTLAGVWPLNDVLANFDRTKIPGVGVVCKQSDIVRGIAQTVACARADTLAQPAPQASGCDSASFGMELSFARAQLGPKVAIVEDPACTMVTPLRCLP